MPLQPRSNVRKPSTNEARSRTEDWVYGGLSVPSGVVLARPAVTSSLKPGDAIQLVGNEHALGISRFLGKLALGKKVSLRLEWQRATPFEHWFRTEKLEKLLTHKPAALILLFDTKITSPETLAQKLRELVILAGPVPVRWILPLDDEVEGLLRLALPAAHIDALRSYLLPIHRSQTGTPSARGYAGWAGALWNWIR